MKKIIMMMSFALLSMGAIAQCNERPDFKKGPHKPKMHCMANLHAMKKAGVDSVTIEKVKELHKDTTLCKDREAYNKKVRKLLGTDTYIKYLETAVAEKGMPHHGMHHKHHKHHKGDFPKCPCPMNAPEPPTE